MDQVRSQKDASASQAAQSDVTDMEVDAPPTINLPHSVGITTNRTNGVVPQVTMLLFVDPSNEALAKAFSQITVGPTATAPADNTEVSTSKPLNYSFSQSTGPIHVENSCHVRVQLPASNQVGADDTEVEEDL